MLINRGPRSRDMEFAGGGVDHVNIETSIRREKAIALHHPP